MNKKLDEQVSAFIDNELDFEESVQFSRDCVGESDVSTRIMHQTLIGESMRKNASLEDTVDLSQSIMSAVYAEPALEMHSAQAPMESKAEPFWAAWLKPLAGASFAAIVALVGITNFSANDNALGTDSNIASNTNDVIDQRPLIDVQTVSFPEPQGVQVWSTNGSAQSVDMPELNAYAKEHDLSSGYVSGGVNAITIDSATETSER